MIIIIMMIIIITIIIIIIKLIMIKVIIIIMIIIKSDIKNDLISTNITTYLKAIRNSSIEIMVNHKSK